MFKKLLGGLTLLTFLVTMVMYQLPRLWLSRLRLRLMRANQEVSRKMEARWQATLAVHYWKFLGAILGMSMPMECRGVSWSKDGGPYIYVVNHRCVLDHFIMQHLLIQHGVDQSLWVIKEQMAEAFAIGSSMVRAGYALVKRGGVDASGDLLRIREMASLAKGLGSSVVIYAEGTRYDPQTWIDKGRDSKFGPHLANPKGAGFAALCDELPEYKVMVVCLDWGDQLNGRTMFDVAGYVGLHGRACFWEAENPGAHGADLFLTQTWQRMYEILDERSARSQARVSATRSAQA